MKNQAFTLIELLVVVLIIGILAAIAVPQYQIAVEKSRASEALMILKSIKQAEDIWFLNNPEGVRPKFTDLDIDVPGDIDTKFGGNGYYVYGKNFYYVIPGNAPTSPHAQRILNNKIIYHLAYYDTRRSFYCILPMRTQSGYDPKYAAVCKSLGGVQDTGCYADDNDEDACFKLQ